MLRPYSVLTKEGGHEELCRIFNNMRKVCKIFCTQKMFLKYCIQADHLCFFLFFFSHPIISFDIKMETSNENLSSHGSIVGHGDQHLWLSVTSCFLVTPVLCLVGTYWNMWVGYWKHFFLTSFCTWNTANTLPHTQWAWMGRHWSDSLKRNEQQQQQKNPKHFKIGFNWLSHFIDHLVVLQKQYLLMPPKPKYRNTRKVRTAGKSWAQ